MTTQPRVKWTIAATLFWSMAWRYMIAMGIVLLVFSQVQHLYAAEPSISQSSPKDIRTWPNVLMGLCWIFCVNVPVAIWAFREALANHYKASDITVVEREPQ